MKKIILLIFTIFNVTISLFALNEKQIANKLNTKNLELRNSKLNLEILQLKKKNSSHDYQYFINLTVSILGGISILWTIFHSSKTLREQNLVNLNNRISITLENLNSNDNHIKLGAAYNVSKYIDYIGEDVISLLSYESSLQIRRILEDSLSKIKDLDIIYKTNNQIIKEKIVLIGKNKTINILKEIDFENNLISYYKKEYKSFFEEGLLIEQDAPTLFKNDENRIEEVSKILQYRNLAIKNVISNLIRNHNRLKEYEFLDLSKINLYGSLLSKINFKGCIFTKSILRHAELNGSIMKHCDLTESDLFDSSFQDSIIQDSFLIKTLFRKSNLYKIEIKRSNLNLSIFSESNMDHSNLSDIKGKKLKFKGVSIKKSFIKDANLLKVEFQNTEFNKSHIMDSIFYSSNFTSCKFTGSKLSNIKFNGSIFNGASFENAILENIVFDGCDLKNVSFNEVKEIRGCSFENVKNISLDEKKKIL